jgi:hypothetical protein
MAGRRKRTTEVLDAGVPGKATATEERIEFKEDKQYFDLILECKCGEQRTVGRGLGGGVQLVIMPEEDLPLHCLKCDALIKIRLLPGEKPVETTAVKETNEDVQEENKPEESL